MRSILGRLGLILAVGLISAAAMAAARTYTLIVDGLACPLCAFSVKRNLGAINVIADVEIDFGTGKVLITMTDGATLDEAEARAAIVSAGFELRAFEEVRRSSQN